MGLRILMIPNFGHFVTYMCLYSILALGLFNTEANSSKQSNIQPVVFLFFLVFFFLSCFENPPVQKSSRLTPSALSNLNLASD